MKVRIGIDVGGTFTDGVAVSNDSYEVLHKVKVPTTHAHEYGVAQGIVEVLERIMADLNIEPEDVVFLAHGTTQATNALLEGDVKSVGVLATASGLEASRTRQDSNIEPIPLTPYKNIQTYHEFVDTGKLKESIHQSLQSLKDQGAHVVVAAAPYSVDDPSIELMIQEEARNFGMAATATHEISSLYGLKLRTRTAVINASILPKMIETSTMTEASVKRANIASQLMIMRCDGGVMSVEEVKSRPIMTLLSGPAAGVAGALMYEKISDGLFLEVGGTSTDISAIKNGEVMLKYAEVGGHKTYVNSLDVRTLGIAGGSMIKIQDGKIMDVGPRSAHIAGFDYEAFTDTQIMVNPVVKEYEEEHETYAYVELEGGHKVALTLTGAANILGLVPQDGYSKGNVESSKIAYQALADYCGMTLLETAQYVMDLSVKKVTDCLEGLIKEYELDERVIEVVGGGGGSGSIVPYVGAAMKLPSRLARNAEVISTIGVALAMVREVVERSILNPTEDDILKIRKEVEDKVIKSGANPKTVEIKIEIDKSNNMLRAIATGTSELKQKDFNTTTLDDDALKSLAKRSVEDSMDLVKVAESSGIVAFEGKEIKKALFGLSKKTTNHTRILTKEGVIKLKLTGFDTLYVAMKDLVNILESELTKRTRYTDGGEEVPNVYVCVGSRILDLTGLIEREQILNMVRLETQYDDAEGVAIILLGEK